MCFSFCLIIYSAVCQYSLRPVLFWKFRKIHKKTPKNGPRPRCVLVDTAKFLITSFLKNSLDSCFCINTRSVYCPTTTFCLIKNDVTHIFWPSFFFGLLCRLGTKASSIFHTFSLKLIFKPVKHMGWSFSYKNS